MITKGKVVGLNSILEYERSHPIISKMEVGEFAWTVPWMVRMTQDDGMIYIQDTDVDIGEEDRPHGTATLRVERINKHPTGFKLDFSKVEDHIRVVKSKEHLDDGIMGASEWIPICKVNPNRFVTA